MASKLRTGWDLLVLVAVALTLVVAVLLVTINLRGDGVAGWYAVAMIVGLPLATYGAVRAAPGRIVVLALAGGLLVLLGLTGLSSIGLPVLVAGVLALVATVRAVRRASA